MRFATSVVALVCMAAPGVAHAQADATAFLKQVLDARDGHFAQFKGNLVSGSSDVWEANVAPAGMRCSVTATEDRNGIGYNQFSCTDIDNDTSKPHSEALRNAFEHALSQLQPGWTWVKDTADWAAIGDETYAGPAKDSYVATFSFIDLDDTATFSFDINDAPFGTADPVEQIAAP